MCIRDSAHPPGPARGGGLVAVAPPFQKMGSARLPGIPAGAGSVSYTHLRARFPLRAGGLRLFPGPDRPHDPDGGRRRHPTPGHLRARPEGFHVRRRARAGL